jgi:small subunit ribosomal protein S4
MARYTGPKRRLERRAGVTLFGSNAWEKRPGNPGQHPMSRTRPSEFSTQIKEKQKVKRIYGLLEKQFRRVVDQALKSKGNSGTILLQILESRLDNIVFRLGFAKTRMQARQFVGHKHIKVNGAVVNIPSYQVKAGDKLEIAKQITESELGKVIAADLKDYKAPEWLEKSGTSGKLVAIPSRSQMDQSINERQIIEFYSR